MITRRSMLLRSILAAGTSVVFTATGWLMGKGALGMGGTIPCPCAPSDPGCSGLYTPCVMIGCGGGACTKLCIYSCLSGGYWQIWWGCANQGSYPCSSGFCDYEEGNGTCGP